MSEDALVARALSASLTVNDLEKSSAWYTDVLGCTVDRRYEREGTLLAVSLRAGDVRILLGYDDGAKGRDRPKGEGFSMYIRTGKDVDPVAKRAKARGATLETEPTTMPWGPRIFRLQDPDGFKLTISSEE